MTIARLAMRYGFEVDSIPGIDGEIVVVIYHKEHRFEFSLELDNTIILIHDINDDIVTEEYRLVLSFEETLNKITNFAEELWGQNTLDLCIGFITWEETEDLEGEYFAIQQVEEFPSYQNLVLNQWN